MQRASTNPDRAAAGVRVPAIRGDAPGGLSPAADRPYVGARLGHGERGSVSGRRSTGFTLVELLVAALLTALLSASLLAAFSGGLRVWERAREWDENVTQALVGLEEMERDIRNAIAARDDRFEGDARSVSIPSIVKIPGKEGAEEWPGVIRYEADGVARTLVRRRLPRGPLSAETVETVASSVDRVRFDFLPPAGERGGNEWVPTWLSRTNSPAAVRVRFAVRCYPEPLHLERTVALPTTP